MKIILFACLLVFNSAYASSIKVDLTGSVNSLSGSAAQGNGIINSGDNIIYSFIFDEATTSTATTGVTRFLSSITSFSGSVGSYLFSGNSGDVFIRNNATAGSIFGGNPFDQINITNNNAAVYFQGFGGLIREDFVSTSGNVAGFPLRSVTLSASTDNISFLSSLNFTEDTVLRVSNNLSLLNFSMSFMDGAFGTIPVNVRGAFDSISITNLDTSPVPIPTAVWLFGSGLIGLIGIRRKLPEVSITS